MVRSSVRFFAAAFIYIGFAVYLYYPHFKGFQSLHLQDIFVVNTCLACLGCYILSRRWMSVFAASLLAGASYGFGPFVLNLAKSHPAAGLLAAALPFSFCPAAYAPKLNRRWLQIPLSTLPFLTILLFFEASAYYHFFPLPIGNKLHLPDLMSLFVPLVAAEHNLNLVGFYHAPITALIIGSSMLIAARRFGIMAILIVGTIPAFCGSFLNVSPVIWLAIPALCCSILIGAGTQGLLSSGFADRKWLLTTAAVAAALSIAALLPTTKYANTFVVPAPQDVKLLAEAASMYILGAIAVAIIYLLARAKLRCYRLRLTILCLAMAADIFFGARFIVDKIF